MDSVLFSLARSMPEKSPLGWDNSFGTAFTIASLDIRWYAIFVMLGFFVAIVLICYRAKYFYKLNYDFIFYFVIIAIPSSLLGARFWSCVIGDTSWGNFVNFRSGGLAIQGGVMLTMLIACIYFPLILKKPKYHVRIEEDGKVFIRKPSIWILADVVFPVILLGQAIGRWGNFFNGEIFGPDAGNGESLQWLKILMPGVYEKMQIPLNATNLQNGLIAGHFYQPLFLYESFVNVLLFIILYFLVPNFKKIKVGVIGSSYFVIYGIIRLSMEPLRYGAYAFKGTYVINILMLLAGLLFMILAQFICPKRRNRRIIFEFYCKLIKKPYLLMMRALKLEKYESLTDKMIKNNYGYNKEIIFIREKSEFLYYWN